MEEIIAHCRESYPYEACGLLAGREDRVIKVYTMTNTEHSTVSYFMDPGEQFRVMKTLRGEGLEMIGIYHSHPFHEALPSARDRELAFYPDAVYVIVSLMEKEPVIRGFLIVEGKVEETRVDMF